VTPVVVAMKEAIARDRKVRRIVDALCDALALDIATADDARWVEIAKVAGVNNPSPVTRALVIARLRGDR
jgi:dihydrodipicolinate synthase/N-acetylneuraminate lyase